MKQEMIHDVVILMAWHNETDREKIATFEANKQTFIDFNPGVNIYTIINPFNDPSRAWLSSDLSLLSWYVKNKRLVKSQRYVLIEWDCWCNCSVHDYFERVWDCDLVVPSVKYPERDQWSWFNTIKDLPPHARAYAVGVTPFCGILISNNAISGICQEIFKPEYSKLNSELRFGTIATMFNFDPIVTPTYTRSLGWKTTIYFGTKYKGLHHPRKILKG